MWSPGGRSPKLTLRDAANTIGYPGLRDQLVGQFDHDREAEVVSIEYTRLAVVYLAGQRLMVWPGLHGRSSAYGVLSEQNMR
jgi:hypothetical protein